MRGRWEGIGDEIIWAIVARMQGFAFAFTGWKHSAYSNIFVLACFGGTTKKWKVKQKSKCYYESK